MSASTDLEARTRLLRARADKTEGQVRALRAEYVPASAVRELWGEQVNEITRRVKAAVPKFARATVATDKTFLAQKTVIQDHVYKLLTELSRIGRVE